MARDTSTYRSPNHLWADDGSADRSVDAAEAQDGSAPVAPVARWRTPVLIGLVVAVLASSLAMWGLKRAGVEVPMWLDGETAKLLSDPADPTPMPTSLPEAVTAFRDRTFQTAVKERLTENVPLRAEAIFANGALQRSAIRASNLVFRFPTYPTYYGSTMYALDDYGAVVPTNVAADLQPGWKAFASQLAAYAEAHPDVEFMVYVAAEAFDSDVNLAIDLSTTAASTDTVAAIFDDDLARIPNVKVLVQDYTGPDAFYDEYFKGDNHWTVIGAVSAYNEIAREMGLDALEIDGTVDVPGEYLGYWARKAVAPVIDDSFDITNDFSNLTIESDWEPRLASDHSIFYGFQYYERYFNFILTYYDLFASGDEPTIYNANKPEDDAAIFLCDSYGYQIGRPLANAFGRLDVRYWLSMGLRGDQSLTDLLKETGDRTVIMVGAPADYANQLDRFPNFFAES